MENFDQLEALETGAIDFAKRLAEKGYKVWVQMPTMFFAPGAAMEYQCKITWINPKLPEAKEYSAVVAPAGLPQAIIYVEKLPTAMTQEILLPAEPLFTVQGTR